MANILDVHHAPKVTIHRVNNLNSRIVNHHFISHPPARACVCACAYFLSPFLFLIRHIRHMQRSQLIVKGTSFISLCRKRNAVQSIAPMNASSSHYHGNPWLKGLHLPIRLCCCISPGQQKKGGRQS